MTKFENGICIILIAVLALPHPGSCAGAQFQSLSGQSLERADPFPIATWAARYIQTTDPAEKSRLLAEGIRLAKERRAVLASLVRYDPEQAVARALPGGLLRALPPAITSELETRVSGIGDFEVLCRFPSRSRKLVSAEQRVVRINGRTYPATVYGRRSLQLTMMGVPLRGIVVNGVMALDAEVLRELSSAELPESMPEVIDLGRVATAAETGQPVLAEAGGKVFRSASREQLRRAEGLLEAAEEGVAPEPNDALASLLQNSLGYKLQAKPRIRAAVEPGTQTVRVLALRVDFSDFPGDPNLINYPWTASCTNVQVFMDTQISPYYYKSSYGKVVLTNTVTPELFRMPQTGYYYATSDAYGLLHADAQAAATAAGYALSNYDILVVMFTNLGDLPGSMFANWAGLTEYPRQVWVNGEVDFGVVAHELGHCFGLNHAGLFQTTDGNPVSDSGTFEDYGDAFDTMSYNRDSRTDFNPYFKWWLGWIDDTQVQTVTNSGVYRVHRIDGPTAETPVALKVAKDSARNYWITIRHNFSENRSMMHGAYIIWDYNPPHTYLINAGSPGGSPADAALSIDQTLSDPEANIAITPVAEGGEPPNEYLDVQIIFGPPPIISTQSTAATVIAGQTATFTVQATGNPPPLFQWECKPNGATAWVPLEDNDTYSGSQTATLVVRQDTLVMTGDQFRCVLTNASGGFNCTRPAVLTVVEGAPTLEIRTAEGGLVLSWPAAAKDFVLETSSEPDGGDWVPVTDGITVTGTNYVFMLTPDAAKAFFRLHK